MSEQPDRRTGDRTRLEREISNSIKLDNLIGVVNKIDERQGTDHAVLVALAEHKTIDRVDTLWANIGELKFSLRLLLWLVGGIPVSIGVIATMLTITHKIYGWP